MRYRQENLSGCIKKVLEPGKNPDIDNYLNDFIVFKLKVADAINEGI